MGQAAAQVVLEGFLFLGLSHFPYRCVSDTVAVQDVGSPLIRVSDCSVCIQRLSFVQHDPTVGRRVLVAQRQCRIGRLRAEKMITEEEREEKGERKAKMLDVLKIAHSLSRSGNEATCHELLQHAEGALHTVC